MGLEVHVELSTATKLFCGCANRFGDEPNTNVCPVCLGLPGSLPVVNAAAVDFAMRLGRALGCEVRPAVFARKNYFYPDMPKDYQISQYDQPTNIDGCLELPDGHVVGIERAHIEEDTGKTTHIGGGGRIHDADYALVDYNRAGVPLVEIVSRPEIRSAEQARAYVRELRAIVLALGVSDARMEEGSMRVDANVSVRPSGSDELRTRCEVKNLSSLRSLGRAITFEARRHVDLWSSGERPRQETRHWDEAGGRTTPGRSKEDAEDYRYFQDPDLVPLAPSAETVAAIDAALPPLPAARRAELVAAGGGAVSASGRGALGGARPGRPGPGRHGGRRRAGLDGHPGVQRPGRRRLVEGDAGSSGRADHHGVGGPPHRHPGQAGAGRDGRGGGGPRRDRRAPRLPGDDRRRPVRHGRPGDCRATLTSGSGSARATTPTARSWPASSRAK